MDLRTKYVVLLKAEDTDNEFDPYIEALKKAGISTVMISPIEFHFINSHILEDHLLQPEKFSGIIFTSPRAVKAVQQVCDAKDINLSKWKDKQNYVVGEATSKLADSQLKLHVLGKEAGSGEALCKVILSADCKFSEPFLFPSSSKSRDIIPKTLTENGLQVTSVTCYKTERNSNLKDRWENLVAEQGVPSIVVFFSPSGVEFCHEIISAFPEQPDCIAIGPTTEQAMIKVNMNLRQVAKRPNPESVLEAVKSLL